MLNEIKCRLMYLKLKARLFHLKKKPECYSAISDVLVSVFMNTSYPTNKNMYSSLVEYLME